MSTAVSAVSPHVARPLLNETCCCPKVRKGSQSTGIERGVPMRPQQQRSFHTSTAAKLDRLEVVAALLERDAVNGRALHAELGAPLLRLPRSRARAWRGWLTFVGAGRSALKGASAMAIAAARSSRLRAAIRATYAFLVDFAVVLGLGCAGLVLLAAAFALTAPPV
jgi:hypothetical protein